MQINITATTDPADGFDLSELADEIIATLDVEPFRIGTVSVQLSGIAVSLGGDDDGDEPAGNAEVWMNKKIAKELGEHEVQDAT